MHGAFFINKEKGCTSRDVVNEIVKKVETSKVGHTGTLDPLATGVLIVCVGKATKLVNMLTSEYKEYEAEITLGLQTDTYDITGKVIREEKPEVSKDQIRSVLKTFIGEYEQEVPIYSAVKVGGKKLYEYARNNEQVVLPKRMVQIKNIDLLDDIYYKGKTVIFSIKVTVSKGTYIRALVNDIATKLGTVGVMSALKRTRIGNIYIENCIDIDNVRLNDLVSVKDLLTDYPIYYVENNLKKDILNGKIIDNVYNHDKIVFCDQNDLVLAIYKIYHKDKTKMKPDIMLGGI